MIRILVRQSIQRILLVCFILVAVVPVVILSATLYEIVWEDSWREIHEKHLLLAQNLGSPISIYINDQRDALALLANDIKPLVGTATGEAAAQIRITDALGYIKGFRSLSLIDPAGQIMAYASNDNDLLISDTLYADEKCYIYTKVNNSWKLSGIKPSPVTGEPTLVLTQPVLTAGGTLNAVLLAELRIELIEALRRNIKFGENGHAAIVDQQGHVIAHPNPEWMKEMRDLSNLPIIQRMMAGETGVTEFYSPFIKANMVAGYTAIPDLGWGIMVPQPKSEISRQVNEMMWSHLIWVLTALILAALFSVLLARWITRPIKNLANAAQKLAEGKYKGHIPKTSRDLPREVYALDKTLRQLVTGLQKSNQEVLDLNLSLEGRVEDATQKLRQANDQLEKLANIDYLTQLPNRRHFENSLTKTAYRRDCDKQAFCILLIDVDDFKLINDDYGHAAGDMILKHVARILENTMRTGDMVARYGGDEFAVQLRCGLSAARHKAWDIRESIRNEPVLWENREIPLTASIGLSCCPFDESIDFQAVMHDADEAMYEAKKRGKNTVACLQD